MKKFQLLAKAIILYAAVSGGVYAQATNTNNITGQWDFNSSADLMRASIGVPLQRIGQTEATFVQMEINGTQAGVMRFPAASPNEGFILTHGAAPNGGGLKVNQYTLIMDLMWPSESDQQWRALFNTDTNNQEDAVMFVNPDNGIGINNAYAPRMDPNTWYRVALVFDLTEGKVTKYLNGTNDVSEQVLGENLIDSQWALGPIFLLFTDNDGETQPGFVNSIQFREGAATQEEIQELGGPTARGIPGGPIIEDVVIESIVRQGNEIVITVTGGGNLQLERTVNLTTPNWQNVGQPSSSGTFRVPIAEATGFFRVRRV